VTAASRWGRHGVDQPPGGLLLRHPRLHAGARLAVALDGELVRGMLGVHRLGGQHEQHPDQPAVLDARVQVRAHRRDELAVVGLEQRGALLRVVELVLLEHGDQQLGLALEVVQQALARHVGLVRDHIERNAPEPPGREDADRYVDDPVTRRPPLRRRVRPLRHCGQD
jgi:hypothetical protein